MSDPIPNHCPNCGADLGRNSPETLCPKCLMENAAWSQTIAMPEDATAGPPMLPPGTARSGDELLPIGADFGGYRIQGLLGRGGMGAVYEAEQLDSGRRVALKVLSRRLDSEEARKRFIREGRLAASINHPNSVYVFGTEEIEGTPTITMEIVAGGNLQERVIRDGPMPVAVAVNAILQIVSGLESAQAIGILHRDVKPSNCFVDPKGGVKIGDFGLSISTEARGDSGLTVQGVLLGTPAFSSPEQLRGDELNSRSDLYSVGATLYFLLTGDVPFKEANMIKLLSRVLEEAAPDPRKLRPGIPRDLAQVIMRCLAKAPADRFKSYAELSAALQPFSSASPTPATLALRLGAYMLDTIVIGAVGLVLQIQAWGSFGEIFNQANFHTAKYAFLVIGMNLLVALYFGLMEGIRGASLGKRLLGLRLVDVEGRVAGFGRAFGRALLLLAIVASPYWIFTMMNPEWMTGERGPLFSMLLSVWNLAVFGLLFGFARRRNGYAGLHGLATGTRVLRAPVREKRPRLVPVKTTADEVPAGAELIGPYHQIEQLEASASGEWFLAYDTKLLRRVWVHTVTDGSPEVSQVQRNHQRPARLRWISGRRSEGENWDAYEALSGMPLAALGDGSQRWDAVRFWLLDLAGELATADREGTVPASLSVGQVWVTEDGHAKLLDFPAPGVEASFAVCQSPDSFLHAVAEMALTSSEPPVPLHARELVMPTKPTTLNSLLSTLRLSIGRPARITRLRRFLITLGVSAFPMLGLVSAGLFLSNAQRLERENPELLDLASVTMVMQQTKGSEREELRRYVAYRFRDVIEDTATWDRLDSNLLIDPHRQHLAREAVEDYPTLTDAQIEAAKLTESSMPKNGIGDLTNLPDFAPLIVFFTLWIMYAAIPSLFMALICRRGLILMAFGAVIVNARGERVSRIRALWRCLIAWSPFFLGSVAAGVLVPVLGATSTGVIIPGAILLVAVLSLINPDRSLQDRIAGTWLVPK